MRIEGCWCGMIDAHAGCYAHGSTGIACPVGDTRERGLLVFQYAKTAVPRLVATGKGGASGGRVSDAIGGALCVDEGCIREGRETEFLDADTSFQSTEICLCGVDLVYSHAVANKVEHILCLSLCHHLDGCKQKANHSENLIFHSREF